MAEPKSPFDKTCSNSWSFSSIIGDEGADRSLENDLDDHNDDELQLQWAAIERLPTRRRLRLYLFKLPEGDHGSMRVVDVTQLEAVERHLFIENLVKNVEKDNKRLLKKFRERIRRVGVKLPTIAIRYKNLSVDARCEVVDGKPHPTLWNSLKGTFKGLTKGCGIKSREVEVSILKDVSGILKPARMTLLLGPPRSGKTTLLSSLTGKAIPPLKITGNITYNGFKLEDFVPEKTAAYISQHDLHISQMTVRETLDFAARCQGVGDREDLIRKVARREKQAGIIPDPVIDTYMKGISIAGLQTSLQTDYILKILGLDICSETKVGDKMRRGISGGQKRRLTTGEMMVGPTRALFMDEISNGLDSSTTFQIISCIQQLVHIMEATSLISLHQPAAETFNLFDDIILMSEGKIIYHGPRDRVLHFFQDCGFICPKRKGIADFLQEVISEKDQAQYWSNTSIPYRYVTTDQFLEKFKFSRTGEKLEEELLELSTKSQDTEIDIAFAAIYLKRWELFKTCMAREFLLMKRDKFVYIAKIVQIMIVAIITMTVFLRMQVTIDLEHSSYYVSSFYYTITRIMANGIEELYLSIVRLPVFYKQRDLYPAWAYTIPISLLKIPLSLVESFIWTALTYYVIGYAPELQRFFCQFLLLFILHQTSISLFRFLASITGTAHTSSLLGNLALVISFMFGGFILPKYSFPFWLRWAFWFSPATYAQIALSLNEFQAPRWQKLSSENMTLGHQILKSQGLDFKKNFYWLSIGALFGFTLLLNIGIALALTYSNNPRNSKATISKQQPSVQKSREVERKTSAGHIQTNEQIQGEKNNNDMHEGRMVIPFKQLTMTFKNVQYFIDTPKEMRDRGFGPKRLQLLQDITGAFRPGVLTALMGVSGAGKTTLMDVLCGRKTGGIIEGEIRIGGYPKIQETFARISGYCEQNDIHSPQITIKESLMFSASLRLPPNVDRQTRAVNLSCNSQDFVDAVLETVELDGLRDALVGMPGINGLSTEQRKRLTIAVELVANPSILFMDEPTSGVDARSAAIIMRAVKNIAEMGRTVICTIHQPSIDIFESFDEVCLMKRGGQVIYFGALSKNSKNLIEYFERIPGIPKIKDNYNPATWMLEVTSTVTEENLGIDFVQLYKESTLDIEEMVTNLSIPPTGSSDLYFSTRFPQNRWCQFKACFWKLSLSYWRSPAYNFVRLMFTTIVSVFFSVLFWQKGRNLHNERDIFSIMGSMYLATVFLGIMNSVTVLPIIAREREVLYRERFAGMYSCKAYAFAQVVVEIPCTFTLAAIYVISTYTTIGYYWSVYKIIWYFYTIFCALLYFNYMGMLIMSLSRSTQVASVLLAACYTMLNLFSGFLMPKPHIPKWWIWLYWICPTSWTLNGLLTSQYGDVTTEIIAFGETKTVTKFLTQHYGFHPNQSRLVALVIACFPLIFASLFFYYVGKLNFQRR
ncbi:hypothetical protein M5K25_001513 [Dendrobium thyrsiflorum]|uniref:ABC transporter domain-containing protein n=1 Tax=Dendrobium thyrsiflorum TaxID=117978 RepID=A0ABD0VQP0_DENTH